MDITERLRRPLVSHAPVDAIPDRELRRMLVDDRSDALVEIVRLRGLVSDYETMQRQHREHVRRLDVALNGDGAAKQASLVDLLAQFEKR